MTESFFDGFFKFLLELTGKFFFLSFSPKITIKIKIVLESCLYEQNEYVFKKLKFYQMNVFES
jgi:hypothetical protein